MSSAAHINPQVQGTKSTSDIAGNEFLAFTLGKEE